MLHVSVAGYNRDLLLFKMNCHAAGPKLANYGTRGSFYQQSNNMAG